MDNIVSPNRDVRKYLEDNFHEDAFHYSNFRNMRKLLVCIFDYFREKKLIFYLIFVTVYYHTLQSIQ